MRRRRLLWRLLPTYLLIVVLSLGAIDFLTHRSLRGFFHSRTEGDLESMARIIARFLEGLSEAELDPFCKEAGRASAIRLTLIRSDGRVLGDTDGDPGLIENPASHPEVAEALQGQRGTAIRHSTTRNATMMYVAIPVTRGGAVASVVRVAQPLTDAEAALSSLRRNILLGGGIVALAAAGVSLLVSRWMSLPLKRLREGAKRFADGELSVRIAEHGTYELLKVSEAMNAMARQIQERIDGLLMQRRELEALLSSMTEGVIGVDATERVLALNRAAAELFQVDVAAAKGKMLQEVIRNAKLQKFVRTVLNTGQPSEDEAVIEERDRFLLANGTVLRDAGGRDAGVLVVLNDVTRLRRLETVRRDFVANVSHELKTPITAIQGFLETLREAGPAADPAESARFLEIVSRHADRLHAIIEDLLMLSRLEQDSERSEIALERGSIRAVVAAAIRDCEPKANLKRMTIRFDAPEEIEALINGPLLEHAVANLIDNAIKFSPAGETIEIRLSREEAEARIRVGDRGPGIPPEHLPRIFERFYRVDPSRSRKEGGTGLGLAIVKHIVLAHRGTVSVESEVGRGSAFTIRIPIEGNPPGRLNP